MSGIFLVNNLGVKSFQSADYNTYYALAEIVDNSIQAGANNIHVVGVQENTVNSKRTTKNLREIIIYDDGCGMSKDVANICLQLGGGDRIGAKSNMGKFGMGLPQASGSQCTRTEIFTWQKEGEILYTYLDYDELVKKNPPMLPELQTLGSLPLHIQKILEMTIENGGFAPFSKSKGTVIYWKECTRLNHKTYPHFHKNFEEFVGRIYRYFINKNEVNISLTGFDKIDNSYRLFPDKHIQKIRSNDPLFLMKNSIVDSRDPDFKGDTPSYVHGSDIDSIEVEGKTYNVRIKFSVTKESTRLALLKKSKSPGETPLGKLYGKNMGVSLLRAGRELKIADFGFLGSREEATQRWWGAEVEFQPELDELFGVTFDKQEAKAFKRLTKSEYQEFLDESEDESLNLMYKISEILVNNITSMRTIVKNQTKGTRPNGRKTRTICVQCGEKTVVDNICGSCGFVSKFCPKHTDQAIGKEGICPVCNIEPIVPQDVCLKHKRPLIDGKCDLCLKERTPGKPAVPAKDVERLRHFIQDNFSNYRGNDKLLDQTIEYFQNSGTNYFILYTIADSNSFYSHTPFGDIKIISINTEHPFFEKFMHEMISDEERSLDEVIPIHLLVGALVSAELKELDSAGKEFLEDFRQNFAADLKGLMKTYNFPE